MICCLPDIFKASMTMPKVTRQKTGVVGKNMAANTITIPIPLLISVNFFCISAFLPLAAIGSSNLYTSKIKNAWALKRLQHSVLLLQEVHWQPVLVFSLSFSAWPPRRGYP